MAGSRVSQPAEPNPAPLGYVSATALVVASMIGAGVFTSAGFSLAALGSPAWVLLAWLVVGAIAVAGAIAYGALAGQIRESGGEYVYLARRVHPLAGFLAGWVSLWAGFTGALAFAATAFEAYAGGLLAIDPPRGTLALALIAACAVQHCLGVAGGARLQDAVVALKLVALLALIACGMWWLADRGPLPARAPAEFTWIALARQLTYVYLAYAGFNAAVYVSEEVQSPERTLPRAMLVGTLVVVALYLALNALFVYAGPIEQLADQQDIAAVAMGLLGGHTAEVATRLIICTALVTSASALTMTGPRVYAKMAADGLFPLPVPRPGRPPATAIALQAALAAVIVLKTDLEGQLFYLGFLLMLSAAGAVASVFWPTADPLAVRPRWWQKAAAGVFVTAALALALLSLWRDRQPAVQAAVYTLIAGVVAYGLLRLARARGR